VPPYRRWICSSPSQLTNQFVLAQNHPVIKSIMSESRLDQETRLVREEMAKRKRARDLRRQKQKDEAKEVLRRLEAKGSKAKH
jgi:hypothetical protein